MKQNYEVYKLIINKLKSEIADKVLRTGLNPETIKNIVVLIRSKITRNYHSPKFDALDMLEETV